MARGVITLRFTLRGSLSASIASRSLPTCHCQGLLRRRRGVWRSARGAAPCTTRRRSMTSASLAAPSLASGARPSTLL